MELQYLSQDAIDDFKTNFSTYKKHYQDSTNEWFVNYLEKTGGIFTSRLTADEIVFDYNEDFTISDKNNVIAVYNALKTLNPTNASDERLWAALLHTTAWDFPRYRRKEEAYSNEDTTLKSLYFFNSGTKRSCHVNCLAKYWWCGHMIYDASSKDDPYAALDVLCNQSFFLSLIMLLSSSNFTANKTILLGMLDSFRDIQCEGVTLKRSHFQEILSFLNKIGAILILDTLSRKEIKDICTAQLKKILPALSATYAI